MLLVYFTALYKEKKMKELSACTTILVGKKASIDGSTMIARNDDTFLPITPQKFVVKPAVKGEKGVILSLGLTSSKWIYQIGLTELKLCQM